LALKAGLEALGLQYLVKESARLPQLNSVHIPESIKPREAEVRKKLLTEFNLEIGAGLGPLAGKIWRLGLMGYGCREEVVHAGLSAMGKVLAEMGQPARAEDALAAAQAVYAKGQARAA
jgi:alanine-glyoxylate transaminase/serine-glyoxylate transaminase/serine-pyruvate transaminase